MTEEKPGRSALRVGGGLFVLGLSASVYLVLAARATGPAGFAALAVQWTLIYTVGLGAFVPFEQEVAREVAGRRALGEGAGQVVRRAALIAAAMFVVLAALVLGTLPLLFHTLYYGSPAIVVGLLLACAALAVQYVQRGTFSGSGRFGSYAAQIVVEGGIRLIGTGVLFLAGVTQVAPYALLVGAAPTISVLAVWPAFGRLVGRVGQGVSFRALTTNIAWLLAAALAAQGLANLGTVAVRVVGSSLPAETVGHFMSGLTVARLPLFAFAAVQAVLLPHLARTLASGLHRSFRSQLTVTMAATLALGCAGVAGTLLLGPELLRLLFGPGFDLPRGDLTWLAIATAIYMLALVLQPAVVALGEHRLNAFAWVSGLAVFGACLLLPLSVFGRVELGLGLGAAVTVLILGVHVHRVAWRGADGAVSEVDVDPALEPGGPSALGRVGLE